jgi:hypothetical protein
MASNEKVDALAVRQLVHGLQDVLRPCVHHVGGPELHRGLQLGVHYVGDDDGLGSDQGGAHDAVQPHAASAANQSPLPPWERPSGSAPPLFGDHRALGEA